MARSSPLTRAVEQLAESVGRIASGEDEPGEMSNVVSLTRRLVVKVLDDPRFAEEIPQEMRANLNATLARLL